MNDAHGNHGQATGDYGPSERRLLLDLARRTVVNVVERGSYPKIDPDSLPGTLKENRACFVTLTKKGALRGCIGGLTPTEPLWMAVMHMARAAALEDGRFDPIDSDELQDLRVEISVLALPKKLEYTSADDLPRKLRPGVDGVILKSGWRRATFLPQVWSQLPDKEAFLSRLCAKAGISPDAWKKEDLEVEVYQVDAFSEESL
jgi:AmmeMemoRadiSam system protein A